MLIQIGWVMACALLVAGCGTGYYRRSADKESYGLIRQAQRHVLGETNAFTIDTAYSARKPEEISPAELIEDRLQTNQRVLTIEAAFDLAVKNSRDYQTAKETLYLAALELSTRRNILGESVTPFVGASAVGSRDSSGQKSASVTLGDPNNSDNANGVVISKLFRTGGRLTLNALNSIMLYYTGKPEVSFSRMSAEFAQPLLRGFGWNSLEVETLTQAERNLVYEVRDFSLYQDKFALRVVNDYIRLLQQKDTIRNRYTNYLGRVLATKRLEARSGDRERLSDVDQARQAELTAKNNYVDAAARYRTSLDLFKITLGLPVGEKLYLDDRVLDEVEQAGLVPAPLDTQMAYRLAVQKQLEMLNFIDQFEDSKRKARIAANQLKPGLKFVADSTLESEGTDYTKFNANKVRASAGLQFDLPLDRIPRGNAYRDTLVTFESNLRTFTARLDDLRNSIENGVRTLEQRRQSYEIQKNALALANRRVESATLLLEAGRAEVRNLIEAQDAQISAQTALTSALVTYQEARLQLMLDIGALDAQAPKFWLKDHLAAFLPAGTPAPTQLKMSAQTVILPEESFKN